MTRILTIVSELRNQGSNDTGMYEKMTTVIAELKRSSFTRDNHIPYHYPERPSYNADMAELYDEICERPIGSLLSNLLAAHQSCSSETCSERCFLLEKRHH